MVEDQEWYELEAVLASDTPLRGRYGPIKIPVEALRTVERGPVAHDRPA